MIITIDGPAGSGKSTAARGLAAALGIAYLDSGATYRAVTLAAIRAGVDWADEAALAELARRTHVRLIPEERGVRVLLGEEDVSAAIRTTEVTEKSRYAARSGVVREVLVDLQRRIGRELGDFVAEGRDQGTVAFPQADLKFYLDARPEVRARRRHAELTAAGQPADPDGVLQAVVERDRRDRSRAVGPLAKPPGAIEIDTSDMSVAQMVAAMRAVVIRGGGTGAPPPAGGEARR